MNNKKILAPELRYRGYNENWISKKLGEVCEKIQDGNYGAEYPTSSEFVANGIPFLTSKALGGNGFIKEDRIDFIPVEKHNKLKKAHLKLHDVLFTNRGSNVGSIGFVDERIAHGNIGPQLTLLRCDFEIIFPKFLYQVMLSHPLRKQVNSQDSGSAMNFFGIGVTSKFKLNIPSLDEQQKIASFLSAVDGKIQQLTRKKELLEQYKKGVMQQLFSGKLRFKDVYGKAFPKWEEKRLGDVSKIYDGTHQTPTYVKEGIPFYSVEHVTANQFTATKYISKKVFEKENEKVRLEKGDILMTKIGDIGTARLIDWDVEASFYVSLALLKQSKLILPKYLNQYIASRNFQLELWKRIIHVAFPKKINLGEIGNCKILVPDKEEQENIANFLSNIDNKIESVNKQINQTQAFKKGLLQQLFV